MVNFYLSSAKTQEDLAHRMGVLTKLVHFTPADKFFASDLNLTGNDMNALRQNGIVKAVGEGREEFICIDEVDNIFKKVYVHSWAVPDVHALRNDFRNYCGMMATIFSAQLMML